MSQVKLDKEEQEVLDAFEGGELRSVLTSELKATAQSAAEYTLKNDKRIGSRTSSRDSQAIPRDSNQ